MTDPVTPPAPPANPPVTDPPPAPPANPPAQPPAPPAFDPSTLSPEAQAYLAKQRADAEAAARVKARDEAKAQAAAEARAALLKEVGEKLGMNPTDPVDPAALQREIEGLKGGSKADKREIALLRHGQLGNVNAGRLADSRSFMAKLDKLDPAADDFAAELGKLVDAAVLADPSLKGGPTGTQPPAAGEFGTGTGAPPAPSGDAAIEALEKELGYRQ